MRVGRESIPAKCLIQLVSATSSTNTCFSYVAAPNEGRPPSSSGTTTTRFLCLTRVCILHVGADQSKTQNDSPTWISILSLANQVGPEVAFSFRAAGERERPTRQVNAAFTATCRDLIHGPPSPLKTSRYSMLLACRTAWTAGPTNKGL